MKHTPSEKILKNGTSVLFIDIPGSKNFDLAIAVRSGYRFSTKDNVDNYEIPHILEHMVFDGSKEYPKSDDLQEIFSSGGGASNGMTTPYHNTFVFHNRMKNANSVLRAALNMVFHPLLEEKSFTEECQVVRNEIEEGLGDFLSNAAQYTMQQITPDQVAGNAEQIERLPNVRYEDIEPYFKKYYTTKNSTIVISGDLGGSQKAVLESIILEETRHVPKGEAYEFPRFDVAPANPKVVRSVAVHKSVTDTLNYTMFIKKGTPSPQEMTELALFSSIINGMKSFSLNYKLRKQGLVYSLTFEAAQSLESYGFDLGIVANNQKFRDVYAHVLGGIRDFIALGVTDAQFELAKREFIESIEEESTDSSDAIMGWYVEDYLVEKTIRTPAQTLRLAKNVTQEDMLKTVRSIFAYDHLYHTIFSAKSGRASYLVQALSEQILKHDKPVTDQLIEDNSMSLGKEDATYKKYMTIGLIAVLIVFWLPFGRQWQHASISDIFLRNIHFPWNVLSPIFILVIFLLLGLASRIELRKNVFYMLSVFVAWFAIVAVSDSSVFFGALSSSDIAVHFQGLVLVGGLGLLFLGSVYGAQQIIAGWLRLKKK